MENETIIIEVSAATASLLKSFAAKRAKEFNERERSVSYWAEDALDKGINALTGSLASALKLRSQRGYAEESSRLQMPTDSTASDFAEKAMTYANAIHRLQVKYGIGGTEHEV